MLSNQKYCNITRAIADIDNKISRLNHRKMELERALETKQIETSTACLSPAELEEMSLFDRE